MNRVTAKPPSADSQPDVESYRLRRFVDLLAQERELDVVSEAIDLIDIAARLDGNAKAVLFRKPAGGGTMRFPRHWAAIFTLSLPTTAAIVPA